MCGVRVDVDRNKCGQTSRPVVGTEIQTCRNIKASSCSYHLVLVNWCCCWIDSDVEKRYCLDGRLCCHNALSGNFNF